MNKLALAEARVKEARARLNHSLSEAQARLDPAVIAQEAVESAAGGAAKAISSGVQSVRQRPFLAAAAASAVGLLLARKPIARLFGAGGDKDATTAAKPSLTDKRASRAKKGRQQ